MSEDRAEQESIPEAKAASPVLSYATPGGPAKLVAVGSYGSADEAEIMAAELAGEGIRSRVLNGHVNSLGIPYAGMVEVELHVNEEDAPRDVEILRRATSHEWEPAENPEG